MADALKTFKEGEDILASETNGNNQYLLSRLSDNAAQVQSYVEGEVATIKSNVASVQATLQNELSAINATIEQIFEAMTPNYAAGFNIASGYVATEYGVGYVGFNAGGGQAYVDGAIVAYHSGAVNYKQGSGSCFLVGKGSTITAGNYNALRFYPYKGFKEVE